MPKFKVHFANDHVEEVEAIDGTTAKTKARQAAQLFKDSRQAGGNADRVSKITRVDLLTDDEPGRGRF